MRAWLRPEPVTLPPGLAETAGSAYLAELMCRRGLTTPDAVRTFLTGGLDVDAAGLPDLQEGVAHLLEAVLTGQRICVYGDYDTDGVTATALLVGMLRSLGADVTYHIPNRFRDGYGMNSRVVEELSARGTDLILTCDCGIRNLTEVGLARRLGMRVVVTDHHELGPELPTAEAVINPKRLPPAHPCRMLPGVGTAYLVARQLYRGLDRDPDEADRWLELVALGIIADVVPLTGANRELARRGLTRISTSPSVGLQALMGVGGLQGRVTEEEIAFQVVPRLNAAGRLADAGLGVQLLLAEAPEEARALAAQLDELNQERKRLTATVVESAAAEVSQGAGAILLYRSEWHEGVLGIAASKLAEEFGVPALLMARRHGTNVLVGSARAPEGFVLHEALDACGEHLLKHGGHAGAAGFSLLEDRFAAFRAAMLEETRRRSRPDQAEAPRTADLALPLAAVDRALYEELRRAAPFGEGNPEPVIYSPGVKLLSCRPMGAGGKHLRLVLRDGEQAFVGVWWNAGAMQLKPQETDLFYRISLNRWKSEEMIQVVVEHLGSGAQAAEEAPALLMVRPELVDRRGAPLASLLGEFPEAVCFAEAGQEREEQAVTTVDRYGIRQTADLVLLSPPPSPRLVEEFAARSGAGRLILAWPTTAALEEERFLPTLMRIIAEETRLSPYIGLSRLAVRTGELEAAARLALSALEESDLLAVDEDAGELLRLRLRADGRGIRESGVLQKMRRLLGESRAFRRFLRAASLAAIDQAIYLNSTTSSSPSPGRSG